MVSQKRYMPTNKRFQDHTKMFVGTKTKKGHLNAKEKEKEKTLTEGTLIRVIKEKIYENGWEVRVGKSKNAKTYMCNYGDNIMYLPEHTETDMYYVPKHDCSVQVSIDEKSNVYFITRINDPNKKPISITSDGVSIKGNGTSGIEVTTDTVKATGQLLSDEDVVVKTENTEVSLKDVGEKVESIENDGLETKGDIVITVDSSMLSEQKSSKTEETEDKEVISLLNLYRRVKALEAKVEKLNSTGE